MQILRCYYYLELYQLFVVKTLTPSTVHIGINANIRIITHIYTHNTCVIIIMYY